MSSDAGAAQPVGEVAPRFAGKTFAFAGMADETDSHQTALPAFIEGEGGLVVEGVDERLDYLIIGRTRTGKPSAEQKQAERLNQAGQASIQIVKQWEFHAAFPLSREESIALFRAGKEGAQRWARLRGDSRTPLDLSGIDLRGADLAGRNLYGVNLDGADLRETDLTGASLDRMARVRLDGARMAHCWGTGFTDCSFRNADLSSARLNCPFPIERCDFTGATLTGAHPESMTLIDVVFRDADLRQASLRDSKLERADFTGANLEGAVLYQCVLRGADFTRACLRSAELTRADLSGANLRVADLTGAILFDADLTAARIDGADFTGAKVTGVKFNEADAARAIGLDPVRVRTGGRVGPAVQALEEAARQSRGLVTTARLEHPDGPVTLSLTVSPSRYVLAESSGQGVNYRAAGYRSPAQGLGDAMLDIARRNSEGTLQADLVTARGKGCSVKGKELQRLALGAWCEVCGVAVPSEQELSEMRKARAARQEALRAEMLADLRSGPEGVERWNRRAREELADAGGFRRVDLKGAQLRGVRFRGLDFEGAVFDGADLRKASLDNSVFRRASFKGADLSNAWLAGASLTDADFEGALLFGCNLRGIHSFRGVNFRAANLCKADFRDSDLRGADLSSADLSGVKFEKTKHDATTRFPAGFVFPVKGKDQPPSRPADLEVGYRVRVTFGTFEGMEGEVKEVDEGNGKVRVELTIFGRAVVVDLEYDQVGPG
jgi:uncharacterized protein YjbI with pentapeptide repeats